MLKSPKIVLTCPYCGNREFLTSKGIYYCAPKFDESRGCGWSGSRSELLKKGKTAKDDRMIAFNEKYTCVHGDGHAWACFWKWWWNDARRDENAGGDREHGEDLALKEKIIFLRANK